MPLRNTEHSYGFLAKGFHWLVAVIVLGLLPLGYFMTGMDFSPLKLELYSWHKSFGTLVLFLVLFRLLWRISGPVPKSLPSHKSWEKRLAHMTHYALYALLFLMPLSGWLMSSAGDFAHRFFGLFAMPDLVPKDKAIFSFTRTAHTVMAYAIFILVGLHFAGALKHHIIDRDETLLRMVSARLPRFTANIVIAAAIIFFALTGYAAMRVGLTPDPEAAVMEKANRPAFNEPAELLSYAQQREVKGWQILPEESRIGFRVQVQGEAFTGYFQDMKGEIYFDPDNLDQSRVSVSVKIDSIETGSRERNQYMVMQPWLYAESFPESTFNATEFEKTSENQYVANGSLTIRGKEHALSFPFTLKIRQTESGRKQATVEGTMAINRLDYDVGTGQWSDPEMVQNQVLITVLLAAEQP